MLLAGVGLGVGLRLGADDDGVALDALLEGGALLDEGGADDDELLEVVWTTLEDGLEGGGGGGGDHVEVGVGVGDGGGGGGGGVGVGVGEGFAPLPKSHSP